MAAPGPCAVALREQETFTFKDRATDISLNDVASLYNLVTVVDVLQRLSIPCLLGDLACSMLARASC